MHRGRQALGVLAVVVLSAVVALVAVLALLEHDRAEVSGPDGLTHVALGSPVTWVVQDQGRLEPRYPHSAGLDSPWESPVSVRGWALLLDLALWWVPLTGLGLLGVRVLSRRRPGSRSPSAEQVRSAT